MAPDQHHSAVSRVSFFQYSRRDENRPRRNASSQRLERASVPRWSSRTPTPPLELESSADFASSVLSRKQHPCGKVSEGKALMTWNHSSRRKDRAFESECRNISETFIKNCFSVSTQISEFPGNLAS